MLFHSFVRVFCLLLAFCISVKTTAQEKSCGSTINWTALKADPKEYEAFMQNEKWVASRIHEASIRLQSEMVYEIPVVFHIVLSNPGLVSDQMILDQVQKLNSYFQGTNADPMPPYFNNIRGGVKFKFVLARQSPDGCFTNGINRKSSTVKFSLSDIKSISTENAGIKQWVSYSSSYVNIWIGESDDLYGYALFPKMINSPSQQGLYIDYRTLPGGTDPKHNEGKILAHEMGHFFNLIHTWGDDQNDDNRCLGTDFVFDTPEQEVSTEGCPIGQKYDACSPEFISAGYMYQNYMDYTNDPCMGMFTVGQAVRLLQSLDFPNRKCLIAPENMALKPPGSIETFTTCNAPEFTTNVFKSITVGKHGVVWAATANQGLYQFNNDVWRKWNISPYNAVNYQDMKSDRDGSIWIAQSGTNSSQATTGGLIRFTDTTLTDYEVFTPLSSGIPSRNARSLFIDTSRYNNELFGYPLVWSAHYATINTASSGGIGRGLNFIPPSFTTIRTGMNIANNTGGVFYIGGNRDTIWTFASANPTNSQILVHDARTNEFLFAYNPTLVSSQFLARGIYFDANDFRWVTVNGEGLLVRDTFNVWRKINFPELFSATPGFNANAIAGNASGDVFIGTTNGLIVYKSGYPVDELSSYTRYTTQEGLPSNNILGICVDTLRRKLLLATDNGIAFWNPGCTGQNVSKVYYTSGAGDLNSPSTWCNGSVPPQYSEIIVSYPITITTNATFKKVTVVAPGGVNVASGVEYKILNQ